MSCTINNMGGAGSAVPKLRDETTITTNIYEQCTLYTATQDCYVTLYPTSIVTTNSAYNLIRINGEFIHTLINSQSTRPYIQWDTSPGVVPSSKVTSTLGAHGNERFNGVTVLLEEGDVLTLDARSGTYTADNDLTIRVSAYY